ncbi:MAG: fasciclin domain-containing protein [Leptolyngbyaceae cyanobacterium]
MPTIVDIALGNPGFETLVTAVKVADLVGVLQSEGPFTVFAPNDDAFAKLPPNTVLNLVQNPPQLARILTYHVVAGKWSQVDLAETDSLPSVEGSPIPIRVKEGKFEVKNATVVAADIEASNGIIHVLDNVILMG